MTRKLLMTSVLFLTRLSCNALQRINPTIQHTHRALPRTFCASMPKTKKEGKSASPRGVMMILSPAKTLDFSLLPTSESVPDTSYFTSPGCHPDQTRQVVQAMKKRSTTELGKLLSISANLAKTAHEVRTPHRKSCFTWIWNPAFIFFTA